MKKLANLVRIIRFTGVLIFSFSAVSAGTTQPINNDSILAKEIRHQLSTGKPAGLYYPKTVARFYAKFNFQSVWIKPQNEEGKTWQAMLMLDCTLQLGLSHADYHPKELLYDRLHDILDTPGKVRITEQARFEILLTDAIITITNNLHYGKLNPEFSATKIDKSDFDGLQAEMVLLNALNQEKSYAFFKIIADVQPKCKAYTDLQNHMYLLTGLYQEDCYSIPESDIRLMAINMERLRWAAIQDSTYIQINIPSYTLQLNLPYTYFQFKVVVGKPLTPTPTFNSTITYFTTAPDARIEKEVFEHQILSAAEKDINYLKNNHFAVYDKAGNYITVTQASLMQIAKTPGKYFARHASGCDNALGNLVFHFANPFDIDLHDMPKLDFFTHEERDLSSGCIWVADAEKLGDLLLKIDGRPTEVNVLNHAFAKYARKTFLLKKPIPVRVTYLTCQVVEGGIITYKDVYSLDQNLEMALYGTNDKLAMK